MKLTLFVTAGCMTLLVACSPEMPESSRLQLPVDLGAYAELPVPDKVYFSHPLTFVQTPEPSFDDLVGRILKNIDIKDFCEKGVSQGDWIIIDCRIVTEPSPHAEFLLATYNPYTEEYQSFGRHALFRTASNVYPALLVSIDIDDPAAPKTNDKNTAEAYLQQENSSPRHPEEVRAFTEFVRSISIKSLQNREAQWQRYDNTQFGVSIEHPTGVNPAEDMFGHDIVFGEGEFTIDYFGNINALRNVIDATERNLTGRVEQTSARKIGTIDAQEVIVTSSTYPQVRFPFVIISSQDGYIPQHFLISYTTQNPDWNQEVIDHMISSFRPLED
jgi:hypothetical protein